MNKTQRLGRFARLGLYGALVSAVAVIGVACSSDDDGDVAATAATTADAMSSAGSLDDRGYAEGYRLVSADWLAEHLEDDGLVVIDLRDAEDYVAGHIPGAINVIPGQAFSATDANGVTGQIAPAEQVAAALAAAGVTPESTVVFYDGANSLWSARALWVLDVYGHANTRILDGAWAHWSATHEVSMEATEPTAAEYAFSAEPNGSIIAGLDEMVAAINDPEKLVCDARSAEEYAGRDVRAAQGGHVPGALNEEWRQAVNDQSEFRSAAELRAIYEDTGLASDDGKTVYVYCQTGVRAAHTWFVLSDLLGVSNVENYDGSWQEYGNRADVEIERS